MKKHSLVAVALLATLIPFVFVQAQSGGAGVVINTAVNCATSADGQVVGVGNPLQPTTITAMFSGTLPAGTYYTEYTFYDFVGHETLPSPEITTQLTGTGELSIPIPSSGLPSTAAGMRIYIGATSGSETLQGMTGGTNTFLQSVPLVTGAGLPQVNNTICRIVANDAIWPVGTGYQTALSDPSGNTLPGYPMLWQFMGPGTTINLSQGLPYYHGIVMYPTPILASPLNHATQSINGPLSLGPYPLYASNVYLGSSKIPIGSIQHVYGVIGCTTAASAGAVCTTQVTWPATFSDTNYSASCMGDGLATGTPLNGGITAKSATAVTFQTVAATAVPTGYSAIECIGVHD